MKRCNFALLGVLLGFALTARHAAAETPTLQAGAAAVDITPKEFPLNLPGGFNENKATVAHDALHARALVLADGKTTIALVVVDNLGVSPEAIEEAKSLASKQTGIPTSKMLICSTHTHTAPSSSAKEGDAPAAAYRKLLVNGMAGSIVQAHAALQPAALGYASHPLAEEVFNRRWYLKPDKMPLNPFGRLDQVKMNPGRSPDVLDRPAGPTDPDITVISVQDAKRKPLALFANYALHYVGGVPRGTVSADYFGEFARLMPSRMRGQENFVAMMSNGASGDINNIPFTVTRPPREPFEQIRIVARKAADTAWRAHRKIERHRSDVPLAMAQREITLTYRKPSDEELQEAQAILAIKDEGARARLPRLAEHYARRTVAAAEREQTLTVKLQAIRIGELAVVGIPFETFVEIGLDLKDRSPLAQTMVIGLANGRHGYLPTPRQHRLGGYETWLGTNVVQHDASDILTENLLEMLAELSSERTAAANLGWKRAEAITAAEAHQAAAADEQFLYAISSTQVAKYDRNTGKRLAVSQGEAQHLNSGFFWKGNLYCAHSNFPRTPQQSELKVLDVQKMQLSTFKNFGDFGGSLTWAIHHNGHWYCNFAHYGSKNDQTFLVEFDDQWREQRRWTYPAEVIRQLGSYSLSGGIFSGDDLLVTGHDAPLAFRLRLPDEGAVLTLVDQQPVPFTGQGIAPDPVTGGLVGIDRAKREIVLATRNTPATSVP